MPPLHTPDGRYIVVRGRLWRATNPSLDEAERNRWVHALQDARRKIKVTLVARFQFFVWAPCPVQTENSWLGKGGQGRRSGTAGGAQAGLAWKNTLLVDCHSNRAPCAPPLKVPFDSVPLYSSWKLQAI